MTGDFFDRVVNRTLELVAAMLFIYRKLQPFFLQKREERRQSEAAAAQRLQQCLPA